MEEGLKELENKIDETKADLVFINSMGEALVNDKVGLIIDMIRSKGVAVRLLSNGYLVGKKEYIANMAAFNKQYKGKFIFGVTIIRGYNDSEESIAEIKEIIKEIAPDEVIVVRVDDEKFKKKLGRSDERFEEISKELSF